MAIVTAKTEIGSLDGTPEKRLFWSIIADYDLRIALTELVDNAVDLWLTSGQLEPLVVDVILDADRQIILLSDNAGGIAQEDLRLLVTPGGSKNTPDSSTIGIFGVGSKRAVVAVAEHVAIRTRHSKGGSFQIDIGSDWLASPEWSIPAYAIPDIEPGTTEIELTKLRRKLNEGDDVALRRHFGETYSSFINDRTCSIRVNGVNAAPVTFDSWAYPPENEPHRVEFETWPDGSGKLQVEITAGLIRDRDPSEENYGVYFYCNDRLAARGETLIPS